MSFLNLIKNLSPVQKIQQAASQVSSIESTISSRLSSARSTIGSIIDIGSRIEDTLTSGADNGFFSKVGVAASRVSASDLIDGRFANLLDGKKYSLQVTPDGKIGADDRSDGKTIQYPPDLGEYYLSFNFMKYERPNRFQPAKNKGEQVIHLPIPANLTESHTMAYRDTEQGIIGSAADQLEIYNSTGQSPTGSNLASYAFGAVDSGAQVVGKVLSKFTGGDSGSTIADVVGQEIGAIPNPQLAVIFGGPTLRNMQFSWRFHPYSEDESNKIKAIVDTFRKRTLPNLAFKDTFNLLGYPNILEVTLNAGQGKSQYLYPMKKCVVTNFTVNYAPTGAPTFFKGSKAPTYIEFSVSLKEIEYFLAEDFGGSSGDKTFTGALSDKANSLGQTISGLLG